MKLFRQALALAALLGCDSASMNLPVDGGRDAQDLGALVDASSDSESPRICGYNLNRFPELFVDERNVFTGYIILPDDHHGAKDLAVNDFVKRAIVTYGIIFLNDVFKTASEVANPENQNIIYFSQTEDALGESICREALGSCYNTFKKNSAFVASRVWPNENIAIIVAGKDGESLGKAANYLFVPGFKQSFDGYAVGANSKRIDLCSN